MLHSPRSWIHVPAPPSFVVRSDSDNLYVADGGNLSVVHNSEVYELVDRAGHTYSAVPPTWHGREVVISRPTHNANNERLRVLIVRAVSLPSESGSQSSASPHVRQLGTATSTRNAHPGPAARSNGLPPRRGQGLHPTAGCRYFGYVRGERPGWYRFS